MAVTTKFLSRAYVGAAAPVKLSEQLDIGTTDFIKVTDLSAAGWGDLNTPFHGAGSGLFTIVIDYNEATEEKILCSHVDVAGNTLTIYNSGGVNGRGYDGTTAHTHEVPSPSAAGNIFPVFTATEAEEANFAAVASSNLYPNSGTSTTPGAIAVSGAPSSGTSYYAASADHTHVLDPTTLVDPLANKLKRAYIKVYNSTTGYTINGANSDTGTNVVWNTVDFAGNGFSTIGTGGRIDVPYTGIYRVTANLTANCSTENGELMNSVIMVNGTAAAWGSTSPSPHNASTNVGSTVTTLLNLTQGQYIHVGLRKSAGLVTCALNNNQTFLQNYLSIEFVGVA